MADLRRLLAAVLLALVPAPALACLPPPPGSPEPTAPSPAEQARNLDRWAANIVHGVVTRDSSDRDLRAPFRVIHVYKGRLKRGQVIRVSSSNRVSNLPCPGMMPLWPLSKNDVGVIAFDDEPEANWIDDDQLKQLVEIGAIHPSKRHRVGTGTAVE